MFISTVGVGARRPARGALALLAVASALALLAAATDVAVAADACFINTNPPSSGTGVQGSIAAGVGCPTPSGAHNVGYAGTFNISIDGGPTTLAYCVDLLNSISPGQCEPQQDVPELPCEAIYVLNNFYPNGPAVLSPLANEAAAVQAAVWHFTDCYDISGPADIATRANDIIADAIANGASCTPVNTPSSLTITPATATNILPADYDHTAVATVLDTLGDPVVGTPITITVTGISGPQVINGVTDANGEFEFSYENTFMTAGSDTITGAVSFTVPVGLEFKAPNIQGIVLAGEPRPGSVEGTATKNWVEPQCGDGIVNQAAEQCDDGNGVDGDGCDNNCTTTACGNGVVTAPEACDDGNTFSGDGCDENCTLPACGNGAVVPPEECDDGNLMNGDGCDSNCRPTGCGNGVTTPPEACDDGNTTEGDGCDNNCTVTACGNGVVTGSEQCDDGNLMNGDGCDSNCTPTACGNGVVSALEECDDGNVDNGDGCDGNCTFTACGNGVTTPPEECDDGNGINGDGCNNDCTGLLDDGTCGNGVQSPPEECDDGNIDSGDGCDENCTVTGCGNGIATSPEECDDGNGVNGDGCDNNCSSTQCGNGILTPPEECDDDNIIDGDSCEGDCTLPVCGNGIVDASLGEQCDDGNTLDGDACSATCQFQEICNNLFDEDGDMLIDCDDPDCVLACQPFEKDPATISFRPPRPDRFKAHGRMTLADPESFRIGVFGVLLTNQNGVIYRGMLMDGDLRSKSRSAKFRDISAKSGAGIRDGLYNVKIKSKVGYITVSIQSFSDMSAATLPVMGIQVLSGGEVAYFKAEWQRTSHGWKLGLPPRTP